MIDYFSILLTHGLIGYTAWRLLLSSELDYDPGEEPPQPIRQAIKKEQTGKKGPPRV